MYRPSRLFTGYPVAHHLRSSLAESHPIPQPKPEPNLTAGQQLALLKLRRSDLARELVETIERGTTRATGADYDELERRGLAVKKPGSTFRIVSYVGKVRADALARESAKVLGLHFFTTGSDRLHNIVNCCCGWSTRYTASALSRCPSQCRMDG